MATMVGATVKIELIWQLSDLLNGLMAMPNLPAVLILSREVTKKPFGKTEKTASPKYINNITEIEGKTG